MRTVRSLTARGPQFLVLFCEAPASAKTDSWMPVWTQCEQLAMFPVVLPKRADRASVSKGVACGDNAVSTPDRFLTLILPQPKRVLSILPLVRVGRRTPGVPFGFQTVWGLMLWPFGQAEAENEYQLPPVGGVTLEAWRIPALLLFVCVLRVAKAKLSDFPCDLIERNCNNCNVGASKAWELVATFKASWAPRSFQHHFRLKGL